MNERTKDEWAFSQSIDVDSLPGAGGTLGQLEPGSRWGRFEILGPLGAGAMGWVYKARDPLLNRLLALKVLKGEDPVSLSRFLQEARTQAMVEHPGICRVFEVGMAHLKQTGENRPYIAMQFIDGRTLGEAARDMTLEQRVKAVAEVAAALHAAHRQGLIHRDVKPSNIMVDQSPEGFWQPHVLDFGLAREQDAPGLTMAGQIVGTPLYISPEQVRGEAAPLDRRSDVYSLGVTLYEVLAGRLPYTGHTVTEILVQVLGSDPLPLRKANPGLPADLETVTMKCLEKEPHRRYDSAKALADDLQRFLDGEPVLARKTGPVWRLYRKALRYKLISAAALVALLTVVALAGLLVQSRLRAAEVARVAGQFAEQAREMDSVVRFGSLLPPHDISREREVVRRRMDFIRRRMAELGGPAAGPGHYALGRGHLALGEYAPAREHLQRAWQFGYRPPALAYALGQVLGEFYRQELRAIQRIEDPVQREALLSGVQTRLRDPAVRLLQESLAGDIESPALAEAMLATYEGRHDEALAKAREAVDKVPWLYEAWLLEGDIFMDQSFEFQMEGKPDEAARVLELAGQAFRRALVLARSAVRGYEGLCLVRMFRVELAAYRQAIPAESFDESLRACAHALEIAPRNVVALTGQAYFKLRLAEFHQSGQQAAETNRQAMEAAERAVSIETENVLANLVLNLALLNLAKSNTEQGLDPRPLFRRSMEYGQKILAIEPANSTWSMYAMNNIGVSASDIYDYDRRLGLDTTASFAEARAWFVRSAEKRAKFTLPPMNLGLLYGRRAEEKMARGTDPGDDFDRAFRYIQDSLRIDPAFTDAEASLADLNTQWADWLTRTGRDPGPAIDSASAALGRVARLNPRQPALRRYTVELELVRARHLRVQRQNPGPAFDRARQLVAEQLSGSPRDPQLLRLKAELCRLEAEWKLGGTLWLHGGRRRDAPGDPAGELARLWERLPRGLSAGLRRTISAGLEAAEAALRIHPALHYTDAGRGILIMMRDAGSGRTAGGVGDSGQQVLQRAIRNNRTLLWNFGPYLDPAVAF